MITPTAAHAKAVEIAKNWMTYANKWNYGVILTYDMIGSLLNNYHVTLCEYDLTFLEKNIIQLIMISFFLIKNLLWFR